MDIMITPNELTTALELHNVERLNPHLMDGSLVMIDMEENEITRIERVEEGVDLFHLKSGEETVNTVDANYFCFCTYGSQHWVMH